ncbi:PTS transporter subunit EIIC [Streptomyces sp. NPDC057654]|uniref:PTS transporter subunit EIIC n=1 Tax=Streptomyces sp. NPDC057654 TaxID=3346196 RepID=UPI0036B54B51
MSRPPAAIAPTPAPRLPRRVLDLVGGVFIPLIPALTGCGLLAGLTGLLANLVHTGHLEWAAGIVTVLLPLSNGFTAVLSVFVGYSAARALGGTPVLGGATAAVMLHPKVAAIHYSLPLIGHVSPSHNEGGPLTALAIGLVTAWLERRLRRVVPAGVDELFTPLLTVLTAGLATVLILMPLGGAAASATGTLASWALGINGAVGGAILGGVFIPGLHQALIGVTSTLIQQHGSSALLPIMDMAGAGQVGAALAVYLRARRGNPLRHAIRATGPAALLGVGEPMYYTVTLPLGRVYVMGCLGGAAGGAFLGAFNQFGYTVGAVAQGKAGWSLLPLLTGNHGTAAAMALYAAGLILGTVVGLGAALLSLRGDRGAALLERTPPVRAGAEQPHVPARPAPAVADAGLVKEGV